MNLGAISGVIPAQWVAADLVELCTPKQWKTISTKDLKEEGYVVYGANGQIGFYEEYTHEHPTLMITCRGATCGNLHVSVPFSYINGNAMALDNLPQDLIGLKYLYYALKARGFDDAISGSAQPQITRQGLAGRHVPLAPLAEQREIADRLDTLLAQVDTLRGRLDALPAILKRFRQSVLAAAVSGGLIGKSELLTGPLVEFVDIHNGARKPVSAAKRKDIQGDIPYYGATGIVDYLNGYTHEGKFLLVGEDGANLLSKSKDLAFIVDGKSWVNNHAHVLKEKEGVNIDFVRLSINSLDLSPWVTGSAQPKLTKKSLGVLPIPKLDLKEQTEIVRRVEQLFTFADQTEQRVKAAQSRVNHLTQSILAKAFRGELTADWREQHPELISGEHSAEALLARIQAERVAQAPAKRTRKKKASV